LLSENGALPQLAAANGKKVAILSAAGSEKAANPSTQEDWLNLRTTVHEGDRHRSAVLAVSPQRNGDPRSVAMLRATQAISSFVKRLRCSKCGSVSVMAKRTPIKEAVVNGRRRRLGP
jgi:hypothetical protein